MGSVKKIIFSLIMSVAVFIFGGVSAYKYFQKSNKIENINQGVNQEEKTENVVSDYGLNSSAVFNYEIYNEELGTTEVIKGNCPFELIGKNLSDVKDYYSDWQVENFTDDKVVLRKNVGGVNDNRYILGEYNGCVAVFYENSEEGIYMTTDIPLTALESNTRNRLKEGIYVEGKERLNRLLEDYTS